jgi:hypothetical protein
MHPGLGLLPARQDGIFQFLALANRNGHLVTALDDLETTILGGRSIDGDQDGDVVEVLECSVAGLVHVDFETVAAWELVVNWYYVRYVFRKAYGVKMKGRLGK